jgi:hypothetical protein
MSKMNFSIRVMNDSFRENNPITEMLNGIDKNSEEYNKVSNEWFKKDTPYQTVIESVSFKSMMEKLKTKLIENMNLEENSFSLGISRYAEWEGWELDVTLDIYDSDDDYRIGITFNADDDLDDDDQEEQYDMIQKQAEIYF